MSPDLLRWRDYFLRSGESFDEFWKTFLLERKRNLLFLLGYGFDTRMCDGIKQILSLGGEGERDVALIVFHEGSGSPSENYSKQRSANHEQLEKMVKGRGKIESRDVKMISDDNHRIGARRITEGFSSVAEFSPYTDVVVDISALPRGLYMPLLAKLLLLLDNESNDGKKPNLHVIVSHSPVTDASILEEGLEESASYLHGFYAAAMEKESDREQPMIWIPVLGKYQEAQLERIYQLVDPDEISPLFPSPAQDPREGDSIMLEYRALLFDRFRIEPRNIIYAAESNPFEVYRQLMRSILHYDRALKPLGGCKVAISAMSSKLASIGVMLAAYELGQRDPKVIVGVAHVEAQGYSIIKPNNDPMPAPTLFTMWLSGECYAT